MNSDKIIRYQGDRLCEVLGLPPETYIQEDVIEAIANADLNITMDIMGKPVKISCSAKGLAGILLRKIRDETP